MASKRQAVALKKLEDQLTCSICLDAFKDPRLLQCFHVYCKDCLQRVVTQDQQGQLSLRCPTCRRSTRLLPESTVSDLQPAFHIHHLFEIQEAFEKVKEPQNVQCGKCIKETRTATSYCRDCGEFICAACTDIHTQWETFSGHEVVALDQFEKKVKQLGALKKVTLYCSLHKGKELELYCETCEELICHNCIVKKHKDHQCDLVSDTFERQKAEITASLEPVEMQMENINKALEEIDTQSKAVNTKKEAIESDIQKKIRDLHESLELRKAELISQLNQTAQQKLKNLAAQKDEVETVRSQLINCLSFVRKSLRTENQREVMKMKKGVIRQIKEMTDSIEMDKLPPCESLKLRFSVSPELSQSCRQYGKLEIPDVSLEKSYATGKGLEVAVQGENNTATVNICDDEGRVSSTPVKSLTCELTSDTTTDKIKGSVKKIETAGQYEIIYNPTCQGRCQLHVKVEGEHIKGSPFTVTVKVPVQKLGTPIRTINGVKDPRGVAVNQQLSEVMVTEYGGNCVSIFSSSGEKIRSFGSKGNSYCQFNGPRGVVIDDNGDILVVDEVNNCIHKFAADGKFIEAVGTRGIDQLQFNFPVGIKINPRARKVYVADGSNHRVQILHADLTFFSSFGSKGSGPGQLNNPWDMAFDSENNVYVTDSENGRIQVFTENGKFLRQIGKKGKGKGELNWPAMITIDSEDIVFVTECDNHRVSVFTRQGVHLTSFGMKGSGAQQFRKPCGIAVDKLGIVYVCDSGNNRVQIF